MLVYASNEILIKYVFNFGYKKRSYRPCGCEITLKVKHIHKRKRIIYYNVVQCTRGIFNPWYWIPVFYCDLVQLSTVHVHMLYHVLYYKVYQPLGTGSCFSMSPIYQPLVLPIDFCILQFWASAWFQVWKYFIVVQVEVIFYYSKFYQNHEQPLLQVCL